MIKLVARGDDAGSCVAANRGIAEAAQCGLLKNISVMACGPAVEDAVMRLRSIDGLDIGLHLTLASEWDTVVWGPLTDSPLLKDTRGVFPQSPAHLLHTEEALDAMLAEAAAQLQRLRDLGLPPSYLDEHMALTWWAVPELRRPLSAWAESEGLQTVYEVPNLLGEGSLLGRLELAPAGSYVYVNHPAFDDDGEMRRMGNADTTGEALALERDADRRLWCDPALQALPGVAFVRYSEIL